MLKAVNGEALERVAKPEEIDWGDRPMGTILKLFAIIVIIGLIFVVLLFKLIF